VPDPEVSVRIKGLLLEWCKYVRLHSVHVQTRHAQPAFPRVGN